MKKYTIYKADYYNYVLLDNKSGKCSANMHISKILKVLHYGKVSNFVMLIYSISNLFFELKQFDFNIDFEANSIEEIIEYYIEELI